MTKIVLLCSSVFLICALSTLGFADEHFPFLAEVIRESVNVRAGASTNFDKIDQLHKGDQVVVLGHQYEWYKIQPPVTTKAFIRSDYLKIDEGQMTGQVLGDNVNIRASASSNGASLGQVKKGLLVKVLDVQNGWCRLAPVSGTFVWIHQDFLKEISSQIPNVLAAPVLIEPQQIKSSKLTQPQVLSHTVSLQGQLEILPVAPSLNVRYQIKIDDKNIYYLEDMPFLDSFAHVVVAVDGDVITHYANVLIYPVIHVKRISMVL